MIKKGFTLAEVLITLGIIGVVAALTAPALMQNVGTAKIGPTLAKVVSTIENANEQILHDEDATDLSKIAETSEEYCELLSKYISGSSYETENFDNSIFNPAVSLYDENINYGLNFPSNSRGFMFSDNIYIIMRYGRQYFYTKKGSFKEQFANMYVDINGPKTKPNKLGKDIFQFIIDRSGQVIPVGSTTHAWLMNNDEYKYTSGRDSACNETYVGTGESCAGSIFENNFKVIYQ